VLVANKANEKADAHVGPVLSITAHFSARPGRAHFACSLN
jgi:hypothetical protein